MPRKRLTGVELSRTDNAKQLAAEVEQNLNDVVLSLNGPLDGKGRRIQHVQAGISATDAVNVGQLRDAVIRGGQSRIQQDANPGALSYTAALHEFGVFTIEDITPPIVPFDLHVLTLAVDETTMDTDRGTLAEAVDIAETAIDITGLPSGVDTGSWLLIHDPTQQSGALTNDEIVYVASKSGSTYTVVKGRWGSVDLAHDTGKYVFPLELRHFGTPGKSLISTQNATTNQPQRFDMYLPARCVVACGAFASNRSIGGPITFSFLPVYSTDAEDTPLAPGMRTLMGQAYLLPKSGDLTVEDLTIPGNVPVQDLASIRCIYAIIKTAPSGDDVDLDVNIDRGAGFVSLTTLTITDAATVSFASGNEPGLRRMPYGINWADLVPLRIDDLFQVDVNTIGSSTAGNGLIVVVQT